MERWKGTVDELGQPSGVDGKQRSEQLTVAAE